MIRRSLSACLGAAALMGALGLPAHITAKPPDLPEDGTFTAMPATSPPVALFRLRPTARRTLAGSLLFGLHPLLGLLPTDKVLDAPSDHPQPRTDDDVLSDAPRLVETVISGPFYDGDWWKWLISHWTARQQPPAPEQNEGYIQTIATGMDFAYRAVNDPPASESEIPPPTIETLPMPREKSDITCPYLRQQMKDSHACQFADPEIGRDVLDNLERLKQADDLIEMAKTLAQDGYIVEAMECCVLAQDLCPGSPSADRAAAVAFDLCFGFDKAAMDAEEAAEEQQPDAPTESRSQGESFWEWLAQWIGLPINVYHPEPNERILELLRQSAELDAIEAEWERIWFTDMPSHRTPERLHGTPWQKRSSTKQTIEKKLNQPVTVNFTNAPLRDVLECIFFDSGINIYVDEPALAEKGIDPNCPITIKLENIALKSALNLILHGVHLTYLVKDEVLHITTEKHPRTEPGVAEEVGGLMKACRLLMNEGLHEQAAELARQAYALDPERVMADPLVYKMHLLADVPAKPSRGSSEDCEPPSCPYCPRIGKPIQGIVPEKKESKSGPTTLLVPPMPPVDYEVVPALDRVLTEPAGTEEASEKDAPSRAQYISIEEMAELIGAGWGFPPLDVGVHADGGLRLSGEWSCGGNVYHLRYNRGCLAIWKTPDAAKMKP